MPRSEYSDCNLFKTFSTSVFLEILLSIVSIAGLIDSSNIDNAIFGTGKFYREKQDNKKKIFIQILMKC